MQLQFFTIPVQAVSEYNEELNRFLRSKKIVQIEKQLLMVEGFGYWCLCITYLEPSEADKATKDKVDYMKVLSPEVFSIFSALRKIRKAIAVEDKVSAFVIFTDAELATIAALEELTVDNLRKIPGIGRSKVEKYGMRLLQSYKTETDEAHRKPD
ncbi:MAG: HRDC domain-containing protein [Saprospiraceae bacterium]